MCIFYYLEVLLKIDVLGAYILLAYGMKCIPINFNVQYFL